MQLNINSLLARQKGVGLIEVVVALFILAIGLLGVLSMQAKGLKGNQRSGFSTEVYLLAQEMVDRIQAYDDINTADDDEFYNGVSSVGNDGAPDITESPSCAATGCDEDSQKLLDAHEWGTQLATRLPNGMGRVAYDSANSKYVVTVLWDAELNGATGTACSGGEDQLSCYSLEFKL